MGMLGASLHHSFEALRFSATTHQLLMIRSTHALPQLFTATATLLASLSSLPHARPADAPPKSSPVPISSEPVANVKIERAFPNLQFKRPIYLTYTPDGTGRLAVISEYGTVLIFPNDASAEEAKELININHKVVYNDNQNEEGLLGLAFHPNFKKNGQFFLYYTTTAAPHTGVLSRFHISKDDPNHADPDSEEEIFRSPSKEYWNHNGGTIIFGPDGYLYLALGDGGLANDPHAHGQDLSTVLGKILRIDVDHHLPGKQYSIPKDNPFVDREGAAGEIWAFGLRNVWRMSFDRQTNKLWAGDVGQDYWEEVDIITRGGNYGWNQREGLHPLAPVPNSPKPGPPPANQVGEFIDPIFEYHHDIGKCIVGGHVYRGKQVPELYGAYLFADYVTGRVYALWYDADAARVTKVQPIDPPAAASNGMAGMFTFGFNGQSVFSFGEDADGEVYFTTVQGIVQRFRSATK
jgi:glucose/arabinose dehydrogenase